MNNNYKILVIDDSQTMFKIIVKNLMEKGISLVDYAPDGKSGVKISGVKNYNLVTVDIDMPGLDGFETAKKILSNNPAQKIAFISSKRNRDSILKAKEMGIEHFFPKPFDTKTFADQILEILNVIVEENKEVENIENQDHIETVN